MGGGEDDLGRTGHYLSIVLVCTHGLLGIISRSVLPQCQHKTQKETETTKTPTGYEAETLI